MSVDTLDHNILVGCIYRASDSSDNMDNLINNAIIHAPTLNANEKFIIENFSYTGINWNAGGD